MASGTAMQSLKTKVSVAVSCRDVPSMDLLSPSDPMAVLYEWRGDRFVRVMRTDPIMDEPNPKWNPFILEYMFEQTQRFRIEVYDIDNDMLDDLSGHDFIGYVDFTLAKVVASPGGLYSTSMLKKDGSRRSKCMVDIRATELVEGRWKAFYNISCKNLPKTSWFFSPNTYVQFCKDVTEDALHTTNTVKSSRNPNYAAGKMDLSRLTNDNPDSSIVVKVFKVKDGKWAAPFLIGKARVNTGALLNIGGPLGLPSPGNTHGARNSGSHATHNLPAPPGASTSDTPTPLTVPILGDNNKTIGELVFNSFRVVTEHTFLDYIRGGLEFRLMVAVDFTASNANGHTNLHRVVPNGFNDYETALASIGKVVLDYTGTDAVDAYGFGGVVSVDGGRPATNFCFPLTRSSQMPRVFGVHGLLHAYRNALSHVQLSGPTYFTELIQCAHAQAMQPYSPSNQHYTILLLLTDGVINDTQRTIAAIVQASTTPLSIIICGIGGEDFSTMEVLDGDEVRLQSGGVVAPRDIVQFVPLRDFPPGQDVQRLLAEHTLQEVPDQVLSFMQLHGIQPLPPTDAVYSAPPPLDRPGTYTGSAAGANPHPNTGTGNGRGGYASGGTGEAPPAYDMNAPPAIDRAATGYQSYTY